jgi:hypothetical protein
MAKLRPEQEQTIWHLYVRRQPQRIIAKAVGCHPNTVSATVRRIKRELAQRRGEDFEATRDEALAVYGEVQREAWLSKAKCKPSANAGVGYLSVIVEARKQQDRLLGLEEIIVSHRAAALVKVEGLLNTGVPIILPGAPDGE